MSTHMAVWLPVITLMIQTLLVIAIFFGLIALGGLLLYYLENLSSSNTTPTSTKDLGTRN